MINWSGLALDDIHHSAMKAAYTDDDGDGSDGVHCDDDSDGVSDDDGDHDTDDDYDDETIWL